MHCNRNGAVPAPESCFTSASPSDRREAPSTAPLLFTTLDWECLSRESHTIHLCNRLKIAAPTPFPTASFFYQEHLLSLERSFFAVTCCSLCRLHSTSQWLTHNPRPVSFQRLVVFTRLHPKNAGQKTEGLSCEKASTHGVRASVMYLARDCSCSLIYHSVLIIPAAPGPTSIHPISTILHRPLF